MYRCPGQNRHPTRGFLYDEKHFDSHENGTLEGWFATLDEAAGVPLGQKTVPAKQAKKEVKQNA